MPDAGGVDLIMSHHCPPDYASNAYQNRSECEHINACHYERHEHESRGPMCSHCSGGRHSRAGCCTSSHGDHGCQSSRHRSCRDHSSRSRSRSHSPSRSRARRRILRDFGDVLDSRRQNSEVSQLLNDIIRQSGNDNRRGSNDSNGTNDNNRTILRQIV